MKVDRKALSKAIGVTVGAITLVGISAYAAPDPVFITLAIPTGAVCVTMALYYFFKTGG